MLMIFAASAAVYTGDEPTAYVVMLLLSIAAAVWFFRSKEQETEDRRNEKL